MKISARMFELAERAASRHDFWIAAIRGLFDRSLAQRHFDTAMYRKEAAERANDLAATHLASEENWIWSELEEIEKEARRDAFRSLGVMTNETAESAPSELLSETAARLKREITLQLERDILHMRSELAHQAILSKTASGATSSTIWRATIDQRLRREPLKFYYTDRANRKWPTRKYVRTLWRHAAVILYNHTVLSIAGEYGEDEILLVHPGSATSSVYSLHTDADTPYIGDIWDETFHPNTESILQILDR